MKHLDLFRSHPSICRDVFKKVKKMPLSASYICIFVGNWNVLSTKTKTFRDKKNGMNATDKKSLMSTKRELIRGKKKLKMHRCKIFLCSGKASIVGFFFVFLLLISELLLFILCYIIIAIYFR